MSRCGRAGEVVDFVDFEPQGMRDVVPQELEIRLRQEVRDAYFA